MQYHHREDIVAKILAILESEADVKQKPSVITLSQAREGFLTACSARRLSLNTIDDYRRTLNTFVEHFGDMPMRDVTTGMIATFLASFAKRLSEKSVLNKHIGLAAWWTWALGEQYVDRHIVRLVKKPRPQEIVIEPFTEVEIRALLNEVRTKPDRDRAIIYLLVDTGVRASELIGLEKDDIDLENRRVLVLGKGNKERSIPFSPKTASVLFRYLKDCPGKRPFSIKRTSLTHLMFRLGKRAGVTNCHPHRFRHTFAITYLRNGGDAYTLQELLGHSTMEMVRHYLRIAQIDLDKAHRRASPVLNWGL